MEDKCIMCGAYVPEGRQVCYECEWSYSKNGPYEMAARKFVMVQRRLCNKCSKCGHRHAPENDNFCSNCGADMRGECNVD